MLNKLLHRQVQKHLGGLDKLPEGCLSLLEVISASYDHYEKGHKMLERSIDLSSTEMIALNNQLRVEANEIKAAKSEISRILNNIDEVVFSMDMTTFQYVYISAACEKVYGYTADEFRANTSLWKDVIHPEDAHIVNSNDARLYLGQHLQYGYRIIHKGGDIRWGSAKVTPTIDDQGQWVRTDVIISDETDVKTAQKSLVETNRQLNNLFNTINDVVFSVDMVTYQLSHISAACIKTYGYAPAEFYADNFLWSNIVLPEDQYIVEQQHISLARGEQVFNQWRIIHKDGTIKWVENNVIPTMDDTGRVIRLDGITRDITERKLAEIALIESEERYRLISENPTIGITWSDRGNMIQVNEAFCNMIGYSEAELKGMHFREFTHPEDLMRDSESVQEVFAGKRDNFHCEKRYITKTKEIIWGSLNLSSVKDAEGRIKYCIAVMQDITARKHTEAELQALNQSLETIVTERTARLEEANKDLEAFNYMISHDLRTPLKGIEMFTTLVKRHAEKREDAPLLKYVGNIEACTQEMNHMIMYLLDFAKVGRIIGGQELKMEKIPMKRIAQEVFDGLASLETGKNIEFLLADLPDICADELLIKQVWVNILSNAIKYSSKKESIKIEVSSKTNGKAITYFVKDHGAGFDMRDKHKLFIPFSRLHNYDDFHGTGAGLAIVHKIISFHQGKVSAESAPNEGATFSFSLPKKR